MAKPYKIVFGHDDVQNSKFAVGMAANHDIHLRLIRPDGRLIDHTMTMDDLDKLVEKVHEFHAEVPDEHL